MEKGSDRIPNSWEEVTLSDIVLNNNNSIKRGPFGSSIRKEFFVPKGYKVYEQKNVIHNDFTLGKYFINEKKFKELQDFELRSGDIAISCSGTIGKIAIAPEDLRKGIINQALLKISLDDSIMNKKYFLHLFSSNNFQKKITSRGSAMLNLTSVKDLKKILIPLPPINEQKRIVFKLEEVFTKLNAGIEALKKTQTLLKQYRQSVLKYAFEGKLTEKWRKKHRSEMESAEVTLDKIKLLKNNIILDDEIMHYNIQKHWNIPEGWIWIRLKDIARINPKHENKFSDNLVVSFLPMKNVEEETGRINLSLSRKYLEVKKGYTPFIDNDIVFAKITPCMENGKIAIVNNLKSGLGYGSTEFHVLRLPNILSRKYFYFYLIREELRKDAQRHMKGTAGQLRVPSTYMENLPVPFPPTKEQNEIALEIERAISIIADSGNIINSSLLKSKNLRSSLLKYAFEGKLVPQDPNDEPASILLERIARENQEIENNVKAKMIKNKSKFNQKRLI
jgi:type I restriction enzyme S subunit